MPELSRTPIVEIDVATDDALVHRYGARIPVVTCGTRELAWPFNADDVLALMLD